MALVKRNLLALSFLAVVLAITGGCYSTETGRRHMGQPFANDTISNRYERPVSEAFAAAREVLAFNGTLTGENTIDNTLDARVDNKSVWVRVTEPEAGISQVGVQVRGSMGGPDIALASQLATQIALKLAQMR
ncbi:MAG: hypothetical protein KF791_10100 [Verrucomicrobiae bacterium]|nr:hypothetical protein [Verrucomicrobiae bacterium]